MIQELIGHPESVTLEYKLRMPDRGHLASLISSFANTSGGHIIVGVDDFGNIVGIEDTNSQISKLEQAISLVSPQLNATYGDLELEGKRIVWISIPKGDSPPYQALGRAFVRIEDRLRPMTEVPPSPSAASPIDLVAAEIEGIDIERIAANVWHRIQLLKRLDNLAFKQETLEKEMHEALEGNLWVLGTGFSMLASNQTLAKVVERYMAKKFTGNRKDKRPDLLLSKGNGSRHVLVEFKRPSHKLTRGDQAQAEKYRDDLMGFINTPIDIILIGGEFDPVVLQNPHPSITYLSYAGVISQARIDIDWLLSALSK